MKGKSKGFHTGDKCVFSFLVRVCFWKPTNPFHPRKFRVAKQQRYFSSLLRPCTCTALHSLSKSAPLQILNWPTLAWRRRCSKLILFWLLVRHSMVLVLLPSLNFPLSALAALIICVTLILQRFPPALVLLICLLFCSCLLVAFFGIVCHFLSLLVLLCLLLLFLLAHTRFDDDKFSFGLPPELLLLLCITIFSPFSLILFLFFSLFFIFL